MSKQLTAIIHAEGTGFVSHCPEYDVAGQGDTVEEARDNLREALELFLECASAEEISRRTEVQSDDPGATGHYRTRFGKIRFSETGTIVPGC